MTTDRKAETRERILDGAYSLVSRMGLRRTTFEDIAAKADVSRQTLYRYFGSKDELIASLMDREADRFFDALQRVAPEDVDLEEALEVGLLFTFDYLGTHPLLSWIYEHEPNELLPHLRGHWQPILDSVCRFIEPYAQAEVAAGKLDPERAGWVGEWVSRVTLSFLIVPSDFVNLLDAGSVRRYVPTLILDGLRGPHS